MDPNAIKYLVKAKITADGIIEKPDVVGAVFGQTEGLLGDDLDLRDLQKSGKIGRIEVEMSSKGGKSEGIIYISSSVDQVETSILAASLETVDRIGPCKSMIRVLGIEDVRVTKREQVMARAKELLQELIDQTKSTTTDITQNIRESLQVEEITMYGKDKCPAGPHIASSDNIIIVEGRSDVLTLLKAGIKNAIAVDGTNVPATVKELAKEKVATAFVDGDRGGELILKELFQTTDIDFVARAPRAHEVEELSSKQIVKCLRNKIPGDQYMEMNGFTVEKSESVEEKGSDEKAEAAPREELRRKREPRDRRQKVDDDRRRPSKFNRENVEKYLKKDVEKDVEKPIVEAAPVETDVEVEPVEERHEEREEAPVEKERTRVPKSKKAQAPKILSPEQEAMRDILAGISSTHNAKLLDSDNNVIKEVAVKNLVNSLKEDEVVEVASIVFDGVISQRILDVSSEKGIVSIIGTRKGNIAKMPANITIWTKEDLY